MAWGIHGLAIIALSVVLVSPRARAEDLVVPALIEAQLLGKLAPYDRNFLARAGDRAVIAILVKGAHVDSSRAASQMKQALADLGPIGGLPHEEVVVPWTDPSALADVCAKRRVAVIYLSPGLGNEMGAVAAALEGKNVLTIASVLSYVGRGAVLGFELVSGRTRLVIDLAQAKKQGVLFRAEVLKLMRVVE